MNDSNKEKPSSEADERPTGKPSEGEGEQGTIPNRPIQRHQRYRSLDTLNGSAKEW